MTRGQSSPCTHPGCSRRTTDPAAVCWQHRSAGTSLALAAVYGATPIEPGDSAQLVPAVKVGTRARIGAIHPFVNENGRVARLYAELLLAASGNEVRLGWSRRSVADAVERRRLYIDSLRRAEAMDDFAEHVAFAVAP